MITTANEKSQLKEFLQKFKVRTMKKDLVALREADSLREREKIGTFNPPVIPVKAQPVKNPPVRDNPAPMPQHQKMAIPSKPVSPPASPKENRPLTKPFQPTMAAPKELTRQESIKPQFKQNPTSPRPEPSRAQPAPRQEKEFLKGVPPAAQEKLAQTTRIEEKARQRFMEEVEAWAASEKNNYKSHIQ